MCHYEVSIAYLHGEGMFVFKVPTPTPSGANTGQMIALHVFVRKCAVPSLPSK